MNRITIAAVGDTHADTSARFDEHQRVMAFIADDAAARGAQLMLHGGDWWERRSNSQERAAVGDWVQRVCESMPLVGVAGNHDDPIDVEWLARLRTKHSIHAFARPGVVHVAGCAIAALPWPRKANLLAAIGRAVSQEEASAVAQECLRAVLLGMGHELDALSGPRIFVGHVDVTGAKTDSGQPLVGADMGVGLADLGLVRADFYAFGHIHAGPATNTWQIGDAPALFTGAPRHNNWGESNPDKGYILAEFEEGESGRWRCVSHELVRTPCRPMLQLNGEFHPDHVGLPGDVVVPAGIALSGLPDDPADLRGAEVRVRYLVEADRRDEAREYAARARADLLERGAHSVKVEEQVVATTRARAPEVGRAQTLPEQLEAFWVAKGIDIDTERRARLLGRVAGLEGSR